METVSSGEFQRKIGHYQDRALVEPVTITNNGRERLVMMSVEEYRRLKRRDRQVMTLDDFTEEDLEALRNAEPPAEAAAFNHEVTG
ncbi:MAG TPA: type II toxin-antitoxin system Phd/YefM family antitoxin [Gemmataceae bacterium]|nr:type II toxin-antitoxin system Phd/YefM family antitoxin [Gemmataceae bacterium]